MNIPFYTKAKKQSIALQERQVELHNQDLVIKKELNKAIIAMSSPMRSMNDELYGSTDGYKSGQWNLPIETLRRQSRIAYWESSEAQSLLNRWVQIVVGKGLTLQASPAWEMIPGAPIDDQARQDRIKTIETRWRIFSRSKKSHYLQESKINELVSMAFFDYLYDGEFFIIFRYQLNGQRNPLTIESIAPESINATTSKPKNGNTIEKGIEYNKKGVAVAYHICNSNTSNSVRVPAKGSRSGRTFVFHKYNKINQRQRRGVPMLTGSITELTDISDSKALEIKAMKMNSLLALWVKPPGDRDGEPVFKGKIGKKTSSQQARESANGPGSNAELQDANFDKGGVIIDQLPAGHTVESFDTKRPNNQVIEFIGGIIKRFYSSKNMANSVAEYDMKSNYTAARGELIIQWEKVEQLRTDIPADLLDEIYKMWLWGETDGNKISLPGYDNEEVRDAWSSSLWNGSQKPDVDPLKSANAHLIERDNAWKTNQRITAERGGGDHDENVVRTTSENQKIATALEPLATQEKTTFSNSKTESTSEVKE